MSEVGQGKEREADMGYGSFPGWHFFPQPAGVGFPQPSPPPGVAGIYPPGAMGRYSPAAPGVYPYGTASSASLPPVQAPYYKQGDVAVVAQGMPLPVERLSCWGLGLGWFLFIIGFFLAAIPWYIGAFILLATKTDYREKPGFIACSIAASVAVIGAFFGLIEDIFDW